MKQEKAPVNPNVIKQIIQSAVKGAFQLSTPESHCYGRSPKHKQIATQEQMDMVIHLIESLQPTDAIEAALASQFVIAHIRGLKESCAHFSKVETMLELFGFSHQVLETLTKYRSKGAQLINVQYNHNQAQVNNFNLNKDNNSLPTIEVI